MCNLCVFNNYDVMKELLDLILPRDVLACFQVVKVCTTSARIDIYLDEKNIPPAEYSGQGVLSKGFTVPTSIQDFPLRGRAVYLHVRRCKWQLPSGDVVSNKFSDSREKAGEPHVPRGIHTIIFKRKTVQMEKANRPIDIVFK